MANGKNLASGVGLSYAPTVAGAIEQVCELWRSDVGRRDLLTGSAVAASALVEPSRDWLISGKDPQVERAAGARVGMADVAAVKAMTTALTDLDHRFGSGHVRPVLVHYLNSVVSGLLSGRTANRSAASCSPPSPASPNSAATWRSTPASPVSPSATTSRRCGSPRPPGTARTAAMCSPPR